MNQHLGPTRCYLIIVLAASLTTCRFDKLINPSVVDRLAVSLDSLRTSGNSGSIESRDTTLRVTHADDATLPLVWSATKTAVWLTLDTPSGVAPDSVVVRLHAESLTEGLLYQDTIVFTSPQVDDAVRVPVDFFILPPAPKLVVLPAARDTSAFEGSALPDTFTLRIKNPGALPLNWSAALDAGWITLSDSSDVVSAGDTTSTTVLVTLRPESLSAGTHQGTIIFAAPGAIGSPDTVPVTFTINPCAEPLVTPDAGVAGTLTLSDCGAPHVPGSQAKLYRVQPATGDTLSFRLTAAFDAALVLTNAAGDSVPVDDECVEAGTACIMNFGVLAGGRHVVEVTTATPGDTGAFTLSVVRERAPSAPQSALQFRKNGTTAIGTGAVTPEDTVVFRATINDPNLGDSVRLDIEVAPVASAFSNSPSHQGSVAAATTGPGGTNVAVRVPATALSENGGHHWQARTCDKTGRCSTWVSFGANPETVADFFINAVPEMPNLPSDLGQFLGGVPLGVDGSACSGALGCSATVTFRAILTDNDPDDLIALEIEVRETSQGFTGNRTHQSLAVSSGNLASVSGSFSAGPLESNPYHWRTRACDQTSRCSAWVSFGGNPDGQTDFRVN